jgi:uncharacterized protein (DUF433 family)
VNPIKFVPGAEAAFLAGVGTREINRLVDEDIVPQFLISRSTSGRRYAPLVAALANFYFSTEGVFQPKFRKEVIQAFTERVKGDEDEDRVYALERPEEWKLDYHLRQEWLDVDVRPFILTAAARVHEVREAEELVECNPDIMSGMPVLKGTRIPVEMIASTTKLENGLEQVKDAYPYLTDRQIEAAKVYATVHQRRGRQPRLKDANPDLQAEA